jgi:hypothetical protein
MKLKIVFTYSIAGLLGSCLALPAVASPNMILNGSFENNSASTSQFNMVNATFNTTVADATAFGSAEEIDLITGAPFGLPPVDGKWKIAIHSQSGGGFDAFSFNLSSAVLGGQTYQLDFYSQIVQDFDPGLAPVLIGLSNSATSFGTQIYAGTGSTTAWTHLGTTFTASTTSQYLTVECDPNVPQVWTHLDNFSLHLVPEPGSIALFGIAGLGGLLRALRARAAK